MAWPALIAALQACLLAAVLACAFPAGPAGAQEMEDAAEAVQVPEPPPASMDALIEHYNKQATRIEELIAEGGMENAVVSSLLATLVQQREEIPPSIETLDSQIAPVKVQLRALGAAPEEGVQEQESVARERGALTSRLAELEGTRRRLNQANVRASALIEQLSIIRGTLFRERLLDRQASVLEAWIVRDGVTAISGVASAIWFETTFRLTNQQLLGPQLIGRLIAPVGLTIVGCFLLFGLRRAALGRLLAGMDRPMPTSRKIVVAAGITLTRVLIPLIALILIVLGARISGLLGPQGQGLLDGLGETALIVIAAYALGGTFFAPRLRQLRLSHLDDSCAINAHRWLMALAAVVGLDHALLGESTSFRMPVDGLPFVNIVLLVLGGIALWRFERALQTHDHARDDPVETEAADPDDDDTPEESSGPGLLTLLVRFGSTLLLSVAVIAPILALAGYFAASRYVFYTPVLSAALIGFFVLLFTVVREVVETLATPDGASATARQSPNRLRLIPVLVGFVLICLAVPLTALIWGADMGELIAAWQAVREGFQVGEVVVSPMDFGGFILVFVVGYVLTRVAQGVVGRSVLPLTGLDAGGRGAIVAGLGYLGVTVSALAAVAAVGLDLSNLAIVAGALSVGIGFGLQNVVNNFVSGLILLVERPIKAGDWVELASGMGYVQRINVRSTVIETFDRAALIVPNSELVSSTVINWTHQNLNGRIIVGVKVAMGTDPRQVERLMLEVARAHPMVLRRPAPFVLFRGYTEYAMSFEVRAVLRDVNWILNVQSDFYFEIHRRFAEEGVEIPVQRSEIALDAGALAGRAAPPGPSGPPAPLQPATEVPALTPGSLSGGARLSGTAPAGMESGDAGDAGPGDAR